MQYEGRYEAGATVHIPGAREEVLRLTEKYIGGTLEPADRMHSLQHIHVQPHSYGMRNATKIAQIASYCWMQMCK